MNFDDQNVIPFDQNNLLCPFKKLNTFTSLFQQEMSKKTCIAISILCLFSACSEKLICPAYQSSFILDDNYRDKMFSPFEVMNGDTVPKGNFSLQRNRSEFILAKVWIRPEHPVLENPYLLARVFNKRPYWKFDIFEPEMIFHSNTDTIQYENYVMIDSVNINLPVEYVLTSPIRYPPYNMEQVEYNKKFGYLFPQSPKSKEEILVDESIEDFMSDTLTTETKASKKGVFGFFKKKNKSSKPKKKDSKKNNSVIKNGR